MTFPKGVRTVEASRYIKSSKEKENTCLFCGEPVEYGWVSDYKGTRVWICRRCVLEGEIGSLMASAILDKDEQDSELLEEINRCLETTQMKLYRNVLHYTFKHPTGLQRVEEGVKEKIEAAKVKEAQKEEATETKRDEEKIESKVQSRLEKEKDKLDEEHLLGYLDDWKSIRDIQQKLKVGYKPLLEKLDMMYQKGKVDKRKVRIETGGHKYKYKRVSEEEKEAEDNNGSQTEKSGHSKDINPLRRDADYIIGSDERTGSIKGAGTTGGEEKVPNEPVKASEPPSEDQLLRYLDDWRSIKDIQQQFNIGYNTLLESLNRLFFRGYLLKKTVPDNPMFKRAVSARRA